MSYKYLMDFSLVNKSIAGFSNKEKDVEAFIVTCMDSQPRSFKDYEIIGILALSRKIDISKKVLNKYDKDWKKLTDSKVLREEIFLVLLFLILSYVSYNKTNASFSLDLKILNSIFKGLDIIKFKKNALFYYIKDRANYMLNDILNNEIN